MENIKQSQTTENNKVELIKDQNNIEIKLHKANLKLIRDAFELDD